MDVYQFTLFIHFGILYKLKSSNPLLLPDQQPKYWSGSLTEIHSQRLRLPDGAGRLRAAGNPGRFLGCFLDQIQKFQTPILRHPSR